MNSNLMVVQYQEPQITFSEDDLLLEACRSALSNFGSMDADSLDLSALSQELICGGWLTHHYHRHAFFSHDTSIHACSHATTRELFA